MTSSESRVSSARLCGQSLCSDTRRRLTIRNKSCRMFCGLVTASIYFTLLFPGPSSKALRLEQQNASLSQAAALSRQMRELTLSHRSHQALLAAFRQAIQAENGHASSLEYLSDVNISTARLLVSKSAQIIAAISAAKPVASCAWDLSLSLDIVDKGRKVLLAANMHNNEDLLPHFTLQLLHFLTTAPSDSAFLSIYESGSTDTTGMAGLGKAVQGATQA